jgi:putative SOS response-associated peptidase YedK
MPASVLIRQFGVDAGLQLPLRYNIAPTQPVLQFRGKGGARQAANLHRGLVPSWDGDPAISNRMINARADSVADKPSFRAAFKRGWILIAADGFYEWQKKQPFYIRQKSDSPFAISGSFEHWHRDDKTFDASKLKLGYAIW